MNTVELCIFYNAFLSCVILSFSLLQMDKLDEVSSIPAPYPYDYIPWANATRGVNPNQ